MKKNKKPDNTSSTSQKFSIAGTGIKVETVEEEYQRVLKKNEDLSSEDIYMALAKTDKHKLQKEVRLEEAKQWRDNGLKDGSVVNALDAHIMMVISPDKF